MAKKKNSMSKGLKNLIERVKNLGGAAFLQSERGEYMRSSVKQRIELAAKSWAHHSNLPPLEDVEGYAELGYIAQQAGIELSEEAKDFLAALGSTSLSGR